MESLLRITASTCTLVCATSVFSLVILAIGDWREPGMIDVVAFTIVIVSGGMSLILNNRLARIENIRREAREKKFLGEQLIKLAKHFND